MTTTVYLVDDDLAVRDALSRMLEISGYPVTAFASSEAFLETVDVIEQGVLVLDVRLTAMSGIDLYGKLQTVGKNIPVIFITGHSDSKMIESLTQTGAIAILEKPFRHTELLERVETAMSPAVD